jgi:predicted ester cyclase
MLIDIYKQWLFGVWQDGDEALAAEILDADLVDHNRVPDQPAGREGDLWAARAVRKAFPDLRFTLDVAFEQDDLVTGRWTMSGTHTGDFDLVGIPATGRPVVMSGQEIFRVREGRFVEVWHVEDIGSMMRSLQLEPPPMMLKMAARRSARQYRRGR